MSDDSTIDLKKRARRRLVGAAALALLAVIVLPIVMDSEPKPSGQEIQIRIPSQDSNSLAARVVPGRSVPTPLPRQEDSNPSKNAPVVNAETSKPVTPNAKPSVSSMAASVVEPPQHADVAPVKPETVKKPETARAEAVLADKDSTQWVVQLGAYRNAVTVKQLTAKLKELNMPAYTEKTESPQGTTRVRSGPFSSREAAEKAKIRIKKIGVDGQVAQK
jgi:DedD protein